MANKSNYSYVGVAFIMLVFGIIVIPRIVNRYAESDVIRDESRSQTIGFTSKQSNTLAYIEINGEKRKVPDFSFIDQNGNTITNKDYLGKVYVLEFFFQYLSYHLPYYES